MNRVIVLARQATLASGIGSLESISMLLMKNENENKDNFCLDRSEDKRIYSYLNYQRNEGKRIYSFLNYQRNEDNPKYLFLNHQRNEKN